MRVVRVGRPVGSRVLCAVRRLHLRRLQLASAFQQGIKRGECGLYKAALPERLIQLEYEGSAN